MCEYKIQGTLFSAVPLCCTGIDVFLECSPSLGSWSPPSRCLYPGLLAGSSKVLAALPAAFLRALLFPHYLCLCSRLGGQCYVSLMGSSSLLVWACDVTKFRLLQLLLVQNAVPTLCLIMYPPLNSNLKATQYCHQD